MSPLLEHAWAPLVGRDHELAAIEAALASGSPSGVVLIGAAGVGKTRLAREALARWSAAGGDGDWLVANRAVASIPFGAVSQLLPAGLAPQGDPLSLMSQVAGHLANRTGHGPVAIGVDDAHLLDELSAGLLQQLATRGLVMPVSTVRSGEPVSEALRILWKDGPQRLPVQPLPPAAVDKIIDHRLGGAIDPISRRQLHRLADGNPLLLRELLADALETGTLTQRDGIWRWRGPVPVRARLGELVTSRLQALDGPARRALETIACGEPLALAILEQVVEPDAIEAAELSGMAVLDRSGARLAVRLVHPLYGEVLRQSLPPYRARAIWGQLAEVLVEGPLRRRDDPLVAGVWQLNSGTIRRPGLAVVAAEQALTRFDLDLAERLTRSARGSAVGWEADELLARILQYRAQGQEAIEVLPDAPPVGSRHRARWTADRACILYWGMDRVDEAARSLEAVPADAPGRDVTEAIRSWILLFDGRCPAALEVAEAVLARPDADELALIWAAMGGAAAAGFTGRLDTATRIADRGMDVVRASGGRHPWGETQVRYGLCHALHAAGQLHRAWEVADDGYRRAVACGAGSMAGLWAGFRGVIATAQGRLTDAGSTLREAVALLEDNDEYQTRRVCFAALAGCAALAGDTAAATGWLARADAAKRATNRLFDPWVELDRARVEAAAGALSTAADTARSAAALAAGTQQPVFEAMALYHAARFGAGSAVQHRLAALAGQLPGGLVPVLAGAAAALAEADGAALELAGAALAEHGHLLLAAEAAAGAARAFRRDGRHAPMLAARERAAALIAECQGARTPLLDPGDLTAALTPREREVAQLAITMSSRQIAERLGRSVRTIDNTLARAYGKLGISGRTQLADLLGQEME